MRLRCDRIRVNLMEAEFPITVSYSVRGIPTYRTELSHPGLNKYVVIRAGDTNTLEKKVQVQVLVWKAAWDKLSAAERATRNVAEKKQFAINRTEEAQAVIDGLRRLLTNGLEDDPTLEWDLLKETTPYSVSPPAKPKAVPAPASELNAPKPEQTDFKYRVKLSMIDRILTRRGEEKLAEASACLDADLETWKAECATTYAEHMLALDTHQERVLAGERAYSQATAQWTTQKDNYQKKQAEQHTLIDEKHIRYLSKEPQEVIDYCERVLANSDYHECIPQEFEINFNSESGVLILNFRLPAPADMPQLAEVKYVKASDSLSEKLLSEAQLARLYDDVLYQLPLRTFHALFRSDSARAITAIVFNGIVTSTDLGTGNETTACIVSVQTSREPFLAINLQKVDPRACFRQLKGVGSSKLHSVTPVAPIMDLARQDSRFVPSLAVADRLHEGSNLAVMDWEEFEHLIREVFEREFEYAGGEVKVTQASRDGGVDAIAFDPDPIRGGKIVIQAKRYSYTVDVSAVRDLYGTVMNEGASKGILVTTSDFGPDAYAFAQGKPLSLLNGANLLHLLGKHGVSAHIDIPAARKMLEQGRLRS